MIVITFITCPTALFSMFYLSFFQDSKVIVWLSCFDLLSFVYFEAILYCKRILRLLLSVVGSFENYFDTCADLETPIKCEYV